MPDPLIWIPKQTWNLKHNNPLENKHHLQNIYTYIYILYINIFKTSTWGIQDMPCAHDDWFSWQENGDSCNRISTKMQIGFDYDCMVGTAAKGPCLSMISTSPTSCWKTVAWLLVLKLCPKLFRVRHIQNLQFQDWIKHFQSHSSKSRTPKQQQLIFICGLPSWTVNHDNWFRLHIHLLKSLMVGRSVRKLQT